MKTPALMASAAITLGLALNLVTPATAQAQLFQRPNEEFRSPKRYALELRFGPYSPHIDDEFPGAMYPPHKTYFGDGAHLMTQIEFDFQVFNRFGTAAVGISAGYFSETAKARNNQYAEPSGDDTSLSLFPFAVMLVYRADQLWNQLRIPLVPYGKIGLNYTIWSIYNGNGQVAAGGGIMGGPGGRGRGGTRGWQGALGLSLALDFIDPGSARELDSETGVNHTYIFAEWTKYAVSGLGQSGRLNVGDTSWVAGLMFEF